MIAILFMVRTSVVRRPLSVVSFQLSALGGQLSVLSLRPVRHGVLLKLGANILPPAQLMAVFGA
jgi:hypothetical protein